MGIEQRIRKEDRDNALDEISSISPVFQLTAISGRSKDE